MSGRLWSLRDLGEQWGINPKTLRAWKERGHLATTKIGTRNYVTDTERCRIESERIRPGVA